MGLETASVPGLADLAEVTDLITLASIPDIDFLSPSPDWLLLAALWAGFLAGADDLLPSLPLDGFSISN
jgi:hypothetical protein